ncbi:MAG: hypothetical protein MJ215_04315 [Spirochaetia bacterium]|nr:hypothetical protein [Spirochaetia bacterium]
MKKLLVFIAIAALAFCCFSCKSTPIPTVEKHRLGGPYGVEAAEAPAAEAPAAEVAAPAPAAEVAAPAAEPAKITSLPAGKWLDANWDALWEVAADGTIKLYDSKTNALIYDFAGNIKDEKIEAGDAGIKYSFRCDETKRFYAFASDLKSTDLQMDIDRDWTDEEYSIVMPLQK